MPLAVVTDSAACLPASLTEPAGISVVELHAQDGTTSRPTVAEIERVYRQALGRSDQVLAVHLFSALSGTVDNARLAAQALGAQARRVEVLDSGSVAAGLGFAALAASQADGLRQGAALARESAARSTVLFVAGDLGRLSRGGRLGRGTAMVDGALGIRPVLSLGPEGIKVVEMVRGAARARRHLLGQALRAAGVTDSHGPRRPLGPVRVAVHHAGDQAGADALLADLVEALKDGGAQVATSVCSPVDPATAAHVGQGTLGVVIAPALGVPAARRGQNMAATPVPHRG